MNKSHLISATAMMMLAVVLGGCGLAQVQPGSGPGTPAPTSTPAPTPTPVPNLTVTGGPVAMTVNGTPVPISEYRTFVIFQENLAKPNGPVIPGQVAHLARTQLISYIIVSKFAHDHGIQVSSARVKAQLKNEISSYRTQCVHSKNVGACARQMFNARIKQLGLTPSAVALVVRNDLYEAQAQKLVSPAKTSGPIATARHILIAAGPTTTNPCGGKIATSADARRLAVTLLNEIKSGKKTFAAVAKKCSADPGSAGKGGELQDAANQGSATLYQVGGFVPSFEKAVFTGPVGKLQLIHSRYGWHIIQVKSRHHGSYPATETAPAQQRAFQGWLAKQIAQAHVVMNAKVS